MATAMKTKNTKTEPVKTESTVEEKGTVEVKEEKKVTKTYGPNDGIPCNQLHREDFICQVLNQIFYTHGLIPVML